MLFESSYSEASLAYSLTKTRGIPCESVMFHIGWGGEQITVYKGVETFETRFKALRGSPKEKAQRGQYLLAVNLGRYKWYQSQSPDDVSAFSLFHEGG